MVHNSWQKQKRSKQPVRVDRLTPEEIKEHLDKYVIGQEAVKKTLSVAAYNHYKRISQPTNVTNGVVIEKSNVLLIGETGTGKTHLANALAQLLDVPFCIVDATSLTEVGYVGEDAEHIISCLLQAANYDVKATEKGIVYIDEIDKIACKKQDVFGQSSTAHDITGKGVQRSLLKLLEGSIVNARPSSQKKSKGPVYINTENILFICGGAFDGIAPLIQNRMGTDVLQRDLLTYISPADLQAYGFIPELIGRLPIIKSLDPLNKTDMLHVLTKTENALIKQYIKLFQLSNLELTFTEEALSCMAEKAMSLKLGARGLRSICEAVMSEAMYMAPSLGIKKKKWVIDKPYVEAQLNKTWPPC
ncbi:ATP-dependent Clp protease ATP-binding subunit ClpX [Candidatus Cardinium hertigii]|jgi:ATP-dependent Clp protease ATP-binding subunit ClpX|uniref:ATP-dependent Clp protease ATP-binding subunit ClpX n=2 Tax=Candidatus Cardinium hertigii TaxID=247481 RepID=A0A3N2QDF3_9BACT|nr:ATP-dependent Clp protease ATP-binding subunit ClpX [Candidatus Cardinium hertigii]